MANSRSSNDRVSVITSLAEGMSIRATERMLGIHRDTIMRLGVRIGQGCERPLDPLMHDLPCERIQVDELWGYLGKHQKRITTLDDRHGDAWTVVAIDADSKVVPCVGVGTRDLATTDAFVADLAGRLKSRVRLSSDAMVSYVDPVDRNFGMSVGYGQIVKSHSSADPLRLSSRYKLAKGRGGPQENAHGVSEPGAYIDLLRRNTKSHRSHPLPTAHAVDERTFNENRELQSSHRAAFWLLQLCHNPRCDTHDAGHESECGQRALEHGGPCRGGDRRMTDRHARLKDGIRRLHGCEAATSRRTRSQRHSEGRLP